MRICWKTMRWHSCCSRWVVDTCWNIIIMFMSCWTKLMTSRIDLSESTNDIKEFHWMNKSLLKKLFVSLFQERLKAQLVEGVLFVKDYLCFVRKMFWEMCMFFLLGRWMERRDLYILVFDNSIQTAIDLCISFSSTNRTSPDSGKILQLSSS